MENKIQTRSRATGVIVKDEMLLLIRRVRNGEEYYVFPGGGIERGEVPEEALVREIKEETNLDIKNPKLLFSIAHPKHGDNYFFLVDEFSRSELKLGGPEAEYADKNNQFIPLWIHWSDLDSLILYPEVAREKLMKFLKEAKSHE